MPINSFTDYPMSWKPEKKKLKRPVYLSLAEQLEADIRAGFLTPGTKLPPQRELADFLDINFTTVTRTYELCERKGLVYAETGRGTFVSQHAVRPQAISAAGSKHNCIDLAFVASFEQCNSMIVETAQKVMNKKYFTELLNYDYPSGMPHHKKTGIRWMRSFGINADEDNMVIVSGALNGLALCLLALFDAGDRIAVDYYTFTNFIELARMHHIQLVPIDGDAQGMLPEELDMQCRQMKIRGIFLMPSCCNPTTIVISEHRKRELAHVIHRHKLILLEDDIHVFLTAEIVEGYEGPISRWIPDQSVYICSTSKAICSGLRIAYLVFGEPLKERILQAIYNVNVKTSAVNAEIVTELIINGKAQKIMRKKRELAKKANEIFDTYFPEAVSGGHPLSFFRWLPIGGNATGIEVEKRLEEAGVQVYHSNRFLIGSPREQQYLRVSLATTISLQQLDIGLNILYNQWKEER